MLMLVPVLMLMLTLVLMLMLSACRYIIINIGDPQIPKHGS